MGRRNSTDEEQHFRKIGSGIPFSRWWPAAAIFLGVLIAALNADYIEACTGFPLEDYSARRSTIIAILFAYPCSPYLLHGGVEGWLVLLGLWAPWPIAFLNWRWARRQRNFWDGERSREAERRKARHNANMLDHK